MAKSLILDSSVIIKFINKKGEDHIDKVDKILDDVSEGRAVLFAPEIARHEVVKALVVNSKLTQSEARVPLSVLFDLPIEFVPFTLELARDSFAIASEFGLTYIDSIYAALAENKKVALVVETKSGQEKVPGLEVIDLDSL